MPPRYGPDGWHRHARLSDIPKELQGEEAIDERIAWLTDRVPQEEREQFDRLVEAAEIDLDAETLSQPEPPNV